MVTKWMRTGILATHTVIIDDDLVSMNFVERAVAGIYTDCIRESHLRGRVDCRDEGNDLINRVA